MIIWKTFFWIKFKQCSRATRKFDRLAERHMMYLGHFVIHILFVIILRFACTVHTVHCTATLIVTPGHQLSRCIRKLITFWLVGWRFAYVLRIDFRGNVAQSSRHDTENNLRYVQKRIYVFYVYRHKMDGQDSERIDWVS